MSSTTNQGINKNKENRSLLNFFFGKRNSNNAEDLSYLFQTGIISMVLLTILICLLFIGISCTGSRQAILNFILLASASFSGGSAIGFLFGLPRSVKYTIIKPEANDGNPDNNFLYADNTNLEEVSDWLTKIIVGLSLVKFQTILFWIDKAAHNFEDVIKLTCKQVEFNEYLLGYCSIVFYFLAGGGLVYLWSRINLHKIFTDSRLSLAEREKKLLEKEAKAAKDERERLEEQKKQLEKTTTILANKTLEEEQNPEKIDTGTQSVGLEKTYQVEFNEFKTTIEKIYANKGLPNEVDDLQKGRWGGSTNAGGFVFEAIFNEDNKMIGLISVILRVRNIDSGRDWNGFVAFFLHDTFTKPIVYSFAKDGIAEYKIVAYEAFVVGARTDTGVELELDLNKVPGFPESFYYS